MGKYISILLTIVSITYSARPLIAQSTPVKATTSPEEIGKQLPTAITLGIADGIVRYINNERRIKVKLEWEPLPVTDSLISSTVQNNFTSYQITINNRDFEGGRWTTSTDPKKQKQLEQLALALNVKSLNDMTQKPDPTLENSLKSGGISVPDYIRMQRERNILTALLSGKGIMYSFGLKASERDIVPPKFSDENITWNINVYAFEDPQKQAYYRFTFQAVVDPIDKKVENDFISPDATDPKIQKVFYDARFKLKESDKLITIASNYLSLAGSLPVPANTAASRFNNLPTSTEINSSLSSLSGFLSIIGGPQQLGAVAENLLGGTENTSIVTGGLVEFRNGGVSPLIGVNQELGKIGDNATGGILFGLGLGDKQSLFLGPSLQASIFTLSTGVTIGTQPNSEVNFAGMLAVDLSRLTNSKREPAPTPIKISTQNTNGLGGVSEEIISSYTYVDYYSNSEIELTKICDQNRKKLADRINNSKKLAPSGNKEARIYISKGVYKYLNANRILYLTIAGDNITEVNFNNPPTGKIEEPTCTP
jgi:hypothetical protein